MLGLEKQKLTEGKALIKYFCQPCAPTKSNGGRTRNLPTHAPDKWADFKRYNARMWKLNWRYRQSSQNFLYQTRFGMNTTRIRRSTTVVSRWI